MIKVEFCQIKIIFYFSYFGYIFHENRFAKDKLFQKIMAKYVGVSNFSIVLNEKANKSSHICLFCSIYLIISRSNFEIFG